MTSVYFLSPNYSVKEKSSSSLLIETNSGRSLVFMLAIFIVVYQMNLGLYVTAAICLVVWSYKREWLVEKKQERIIGFRKIAGVKMQRKEFKFSDLNEIKIEREKFGGQQGFRYTLSLVTVDEQDFTIASRDRLHLLNPIAIEIRKFLPISVKFTMLDLENEDESFLRIT